VSPADSSGKEDGAGDELDERFAPDVDSTFGPSTDVASESNPSQAEIRGEIRILLEDTSRTDPASRQSYIVGLVDMLHEAEKNERDGRDTGVTNKQKQKKRAEPPERKELRKDRSVRETTRQDLRRVFKDAPAQKTDRERSPVTIRPERRETSESGSQ
jgi:hypothetical protein